MREKIEIFGFDKGGNWSKHQVDSKKISDLFCNAKNRGINLNPLRINFRSNNKAKKYHSKTFQHIFVTYEDLEKLEQEVNLS
jgi:U3 small nucleolar RNA-associated protein 14